MKMFSKRDVSEPGGSRGGWALVGRLLFWSMRHAR